MKANCPRAGGTGSDEDAPHDNAKVITVKSNLRVKSQGLSNLRVKSQGPVCALRFFYAKTLKRRFLLQDIPRPTGLVIVSIDVADDASAAQAYLVKMHYPWPNFHDHGEVDAAFGTDGVPRTILVDAKGEIVFDRVSSTPEELRGAIAKLGPEYAAAVADRH